jgi:thymidylate kinase
MQRLLELTTPDMLFYLDVPTEDLLERLTPDDPKYVFRRRNIMSSAISFDDAFKHYEDSDNCLRINGNLEPIEVQEQIECAILASNILDSTRSRND